MEIILHKNNTSLSTIPGEYFKSPFVIEIYFQPFLDQRIDIVLY